MSAKYTLSLDWVIFCGYQKIRENMRPDKKIEILYLVSLDHKCIVFIFSMQHYQIMTQTEIVSHHYNPLLKRIKKNICSIPIDVL